MRLRPGGSCWTVVVLGQVLPIFSDSLASYLLVCLWWLFFRLLQSILCYVPALHFIRVLVTTSRINEEKCQKAKRTAPGPPPGIHSRRHNIIRQRRMAGIWVHLKSSERCSRIIITAGSYRRVFLMDGEDGRNKKTCMHAGHVSELPNMLLIL